MCPGPSSYFTLLVPSKRSLQKDKKIKKPHPHWYELNVKKTTLKFQLFSGSSFVRVVRKVLLLPQLYLLFTTHHLHPAHHLSFLSTLCFETFKNTSLLPGQKNDPRQDQRKRHAFQTLTPNFLHNHHYLSPLSWCNSPHTLASLPSPQTTIQARRRRHLRAQHFISASHLYHHAVHSHHKKSQQARVHLLWQAFSFCVV